MLAMFYDCNDSIVYYEPCENMKQCVYMSEYACVHWNFSNTGNSLNPTITKLQHEVNIRAISCHRKLKNLKSFFTYIVWISLTCVSIFIDLQKFSFNAAKYEAIVASFSYFKIRQQLPICQSNWACILLLTGAMKGISSTYNLKL